MRARYESFGGIVALDRPPATVYVDRAYMRELGYDESPLWDVERSHLSAPTTVHFAITHQCPMNCRTCYNAAGEASAGELSTEEAKGVLDVLAQMRVFTVTFGGGEPLARPDVFELAEHARRLGLTPTTTTNGLYVDREIAQRCRAFSHVHVSIDGVGETYRAVRGVDGFEHAARALKLLKHSRVSVGVNCVVCRANFDHLEQLVRFMVRCGVRDVAFLRVRPSGRAGPWYEDMRLTPEQRVELYPLLKRLIKRYRLQAQVDCGMVPFICWHKPDEEMLRLFGVEGCVGANEVIEIRPNGQVRACGFATEIAGSAFDLPDFWHEAQPFEQVRGRHRVVREPCRSCRYLALCRGGCQTVSAALTGDPKAPDPECPFVSEEKTHA